MLSKSNQSYNLVIPTQFNVTPPDKHKFLVSYCFKAPPTTDFKVSSVHCCKPAAMSNFVCSTSFSSIPTSTVSFKNL